MTLEEKLKQLPTSAGVYQYFNKNGKLLYIGKAKILKNRVKSYFRFTPTLSPSEKLSPRIFKMISEVAQLDYIVVSNENDALILENSLIKQLKPKYNILLRDDKTYPYIYVDYNDDSWRIDEYAVTHKEVQFTFDIIFRNNVIDTCLISTLHTAKYIINAYIIYGMIFY